MNRVACVQFAARRYETPAEFTAQVSGLVARAAGLGAEMVVFPAYLGLVYLAAAHREADLALGPGFGTAVARIFASAEGGSPEADFLRLFSGLAAQYHVYIAPGTIPVPAAGGVRNLAHLLSPEGKVIGSQAQTHLARDERAGGFVSAGDLDVFPTSLGTVGFAICTDAWYPEVMRILALRGAQIVLAPVAVPAPYGEWHQVRGMWQNVQQNQVFGVEACLAGEACGLEFAGRSAIYATCEMTEGETGVLACVGSSTAEEIILADLSFPSLQETIERFPIFRHFNRGLYYKWFPRVYQNHAAARDAGRPSTGGAGPSGRTSAALGHGAHPSKIRVAAVQMRLELIEDAGTYAEKIRTLTGAAADQGAQLVVFPEDSGTPLAGLIPGLEELAAKGMDAAVADLTGRGMKVAEIFREISPAVKRIYETTFSTLAKEFRLYIITGSAYLEDDDGRMRVIGYFYGPDGEILAKQRKLHLVPMEAAWGFEPGSDLEVLDTPLGRIAFPICMDATYFETFRLARLRGAEIVAVPSANNEEYIFWRTMRGIWPRVQESQVFGISAAAVGNLLGMPFTGRSGLLAPLEMTPSGDGWLARAVSFDQEEIVVGDLDLDALRRFRDENPLDVNLALYEKYLPGLYRRG